LDEDGDGTYDAEGITAIAGALRVNGSITVADLRYNSLDMESANLLVTIAKAKKISLCGITPGQTEADFRPEKNDYARMSPADAILLTADLAVIGSITKVCLQYNNLDDDAKQLLTDANNACATPAILEL